MSHMTAMMERDSLHSELEYSFMQEMEKNNLEDLT